MNRTPVLGGQEQFMGDVEIGLDLVCMKMSIIKFYASLFAPNALHSHLRCTQWMFKIRTFFLSHFSIYRCPMKCIGAANKWLLNWPSFYCSELLKAFDVPFENRQFSVQHLSMTANILIELCYEWFAMNSYGFFFAQSEFLTFFFCLGNKKSGCIWN